MATETKEKRSARQYKTASRRDVSSLARGYCRSGKNVSYLIAEAAPDSATGMARILVSNWSFDTIEDVGLTAITRLVESSISTFPGAVPCGWHPLALAALVACDEVAHLSLHEQQEVFLLKLPSGKKRYIALISADEADALNTAELQRLQMGLCHLLSGYKANTNPIGELLSERERECLYWVSEGKTADEVSLIINVSSNTVNSYVAHAIHKLAAKNRAMAIATAIRNGLI